MRLNLESNENRSVEVSGTTKNWERREKERVIRVKDRDRERERERRCKRENN